MFRYAFLFIKY